MPDDDLGERVTAVIELKPGRSVTAEEFRALRRQTLDPIRTPKECPEPVASRSEPEG